MFLVKCTCTDSDCAAMSEVEAASVADAEREVCVECDCVVQVLGVSELVLVGP